MFRPGGIDPMSAAERRVDLLADLVAAGPRTGADDRRDVALATEIAQRAHALLEDASRQPAPAGVHHRYGAFVPSATGRQSAVSTIAPMPTTEVA